MKKRIDRPEGLRYERTRIRSVKVVFAKHPPECEELPFTAKTHGKFIAYTDRTGTFGLFGLLWMENLQKGDYSSGAIERMAKAVNLIDHWDIMSIFYRLGSIGARKMAIERIGDCIGGGIIEVDHQNRIMTVGGTSRFGSVPKDILARLVHYADYKCEIRTASQSISPSSYLEIPQDVLTAQAVK